MFAAPPLAPPSGLTYATNPAAYPVGQAIAPNVPSVTGPVDAFGVFPPLPAGLLLDPTAGGGTGTRFGLSEGLQVIIGAF